MTESDLRRLLKHGTPADVADVLVSRSEGERRALAGMVQAIATAPVLDADTTAGERRAERQEAAMLIAGAACLPSAPEVVAWLRSRRFRRIPSPAAAEALAQVLTVPGRPEPAAVADGLARRLRSRTSRPADWTVAATALRAAEMPPPDTEGFLRGWVRDHTPADADRLAADPWLDAQLPRVFDVPAVSATLDATWPAELARLAAEGRLSRADLLDRTLRAVRDGGSPAAVATYRLLAPTPDERTSHLADYRALLADPQPAVAELAQEGLRELDEAGQLPADTVAEVSRAVLSRTDGKLSRAQLAWLAESVARHPQEAAALLATVTTALTCDSDETAELALAVLADHSAGRTALRKSLRKLTGPLRAKADEVLNPQPNPPAGSAPARPSSPTRRARRTPAAPAKSAVPGRPKPGTKRTPASTPAAESPTPSDTPAPIAAPPASTPAAESPTPSDTPAPIAEQPASTPAAESPTPSDTPAPIAEQPAADISAPATSPEATAELPEAGSQPATALPDLDAASTRETAAAPLSPSAWLAALQSQTRSARIEPTGPEVPTEPAIRPASDGQVASPSPSARLRDLSALTQLTPAEISVPSSSTAERAPSDAHLPEPSASHAQAEVTSPTLPATSALSSSAPPPSHRLDRPTTTAATDTPSADVVAPVSPTSGPLSTIIPPSPGGTRVPPVFSAELTSSAPFVPSTEPTPSEEPMLFSRPALRGMSAPSAPPVASDAQIPPPATPEAELEPRPTDISTQQAELHAAQAKSRLPQTPPQLPQTDSRTPQAPPVKSRTTQAAPLPQIAQPLPQAGTGTPQAALLPQTEDRATQSASLPETETRRSHAASQPRIEINIPQAAPPLPHTEDGTSHAAPLPQTEDRTTHTAALPQGANRATHAAPLPQTETRSFQAAPALGTAERLRDRALPAAPPTPQVGTDAPAEQLRRMSVAATEAPPHLPENGSCASPPTPPLPSRGESRTPQAGPPVSPEESRTSMDAPPSAESRPLQTAPSHAPNEPRVAEAGPQSRTLEASPSQDASRKLAETRVPDAAPSTLQVESRTPRAEPHVSPVKSRTPRVFPPAPVRYLAEQMPPPIATVAELAAAMEARVHDPLEPVGVERLLAGVAALAQVDRESMSAALAPLAGVVPAPFDGIVAALAAPEIRPRSDAEAPPTDYFGRWEKDPGGRSTAHLSRRASERRRGDTKAGGPPPQAMLFGRVRELAGQLAKGAPPPRLLATPASVDGQVNPARVLLFLVQAERDGWQPGPYDLAQALLRLPRHVDGSIVEAAGRLASPAGRRLAAWLRVGGLADPVLTVVAHGDDPARRTVAVARSMARGPMAARRGRPEALDLTGLAFPDGLLEPVAQPPVGLGGGGGAGEVTIPATTAGGHRRTAASATVGPVRPGRVGPAYPGSGTARSNGNAAHTRPSGNGNAAHASTNGNSNAAHASTNGNGNGNGNGNTAHVGPGAGNGNAVPQTDSAANGNAVQGKAARGASGTAGSKGNGHGNEAGIRPEARGYRGNTAYFGSGARGDGNAMTPHDRSGVAPNGNRVPANGGATDRRVGGGDADGGGAELVDAGGGGRSAREGGGRAPDMRGWPLVMPGHRDVVAAHCLPYVAVAAERGGGLAILGGLARAAGPFGPGMALALAHGLTAVRDEDRRAAVDAVGHLVATGGLDAGLLGRELSVLLHTGGDNLTERAAAALSLVGEGGAWHVVWAVAHAVVPTLLRMAEPPAGLAALLAVATEAAAVTGARAGLPEVAAVAARRDGTELSAAARRLADTIG